MYATGDSTLQVMSVGRYRYGLIQVIIRVILWVDTGDSTGNLSVDAGDRTGNLWVTAGDRTGNLWVDAGDCTLQVFFFSYACHLP